jgi:hypothetical protein
LSGGLGSTGSFYSKVISTTGEFIKMVNFFQPQVKKLLAEKYFSLPSAYPIFAGLPEKIARSTFT